MSKKANPAAIGLFVVVALAVAGIAIVVLGSGKFFQASKQFVLFFEGSLSGLDVGAPVEYRGVRIGSVTDVHLEYDSNSGTIQSPVMIELERNRMMYSGEDGQTLGLAHHVELGLRAQLQSQSFVTGKLKVMLVDRPGSPLILRNKNEDLREIPTIRSLTESLQKTIEEMPIETIVTNLNATMQEVAKFSRSGDMQKIVDNVNVALLQISALASNLDSSVQPLLVSAKRNSDEFLKTQQEAATAIREIRSMLGDESPVRYQTMVAMEELAQAAESLRNLLDYLQQHPEALLTGKSEPSTE